MRKFLGHIFLLPLALLLSGCNIWTDWQRDGSLSELTISVTVSNTPASPMTRVDIDPGHYVEPTSAGEMMQTLRIVIVRPDGTVEHNRLLDFSGNAKGAYMSVENVAFEVHGNETKQVYLFVNENAEQFSIDGKAKVKLVDLNDVAGLAPGDTFPVEALSDMQVNLYSKSDEVPSEALPMSECHTVEMPGRDYHADLYVTRAAVKFTYIIDNKTGQDFTLSQLQILKGSSKEYYLPRITYTGDPFSGSFNVIDYVVPNIETNNYYEFTKSFSKTITASGDSGDGVTKLDPIYLLEGKYEDASSDGKNYSMTMTLNGQIYTEYFPNLSTLPRNTHVVVVVTLGKYDINWTVDVYPYGEVVLKPGFGQ